MGTLGGSPLSTVRSSRTGSQHGLGSVKLSVLLCSSPVGLAYPTVVVSFDEVRFDAFGWFAIRASIAMLGRGYLVDNLSSVHVAFFVML